MEDSMMNDSGADLLPAGQMLMRDLAGMDGVLDIWFVNKNEAADEGRQLFADDPDMLALIESNPGLLPASIRVRVEDRAAQEAVVNGASNRPGVKDVKAAPPPRP